jgi:predicted metal-dependent phosphoesterase TrpH
MSADLHIHTNLSDGTHSPEEIIELAKKAGLKTIAVTDHDTVDGLERAIIQGEKSGVEVIPGIEFTTEVPRTEIHILGYFVDYKNPQFLEMLGKIQQGRVNRIYKMVEKLKGLGVEIEAEEVFKLSGEGAPGRPHVARVLIQKGAVGNFREAFRKYLEFRGPAYVSHYRLTPIEAIKLILDAGGIPVYAHPGTSSYDAIIPELMTSGLLGLEVYYISHSILQARHYLSLAKKYGLLITGGSDYHGLKSGREVELGEIVIDDNLVNKLKRAKAEMMR